MMHVDDETTLCEVTQRKMTNMLWTCYDRLKDIRVHLLCTCLRVPDSAARLLSIVGYAAWLAFFCCPVPLLL